ncbi:hypothetical protein F4821DRAFT_165025 [Hypoxylon rubiginosum]|uniref:Uncharacterized protein n=1 Tax=Hypoxylon rubiginosum TaxID=110542 RepID=A0ACC0CWY8_9PEZI|nr:hypothetical protein F4821DRAFT_165025 [Hypoxylon rubiginosum]
MSLPKLTPEEEAHLNDTRQPELWGCLIAFLIINDVVIAGRLWGTWTSVTSRSRVMAEDILIVLSGVFVNAIIANLIAATHYGLGLHVYTVNARDPEYPSNLSKTFRHVWITMVLMSGFFTCIKMTLLFFYKRLFLVGRSGLRIFWWANFVYIVLWFFGATSFYLFQCKPVQWYFIQYFERYPHLPVPGNMSGQCDATSVVHVALPLIFSLVSDISLLLLPLWAISKLRLNKNKKRGLMAVFGIGLIACLLELGRILALLIDTDDKTDPSYGVAVFLILTAAEETTAVVCACLPVIVPQLVRMYRGKVKKNEYSYDNGGHVSSERQSPRGFKRVASVNQIWSIPVTISKVDRPHDDDVPLTSVEITGNAAAKPDQDGDSDYMRRQRAEDVESQTDQSYSPSHSGDVSQIGRTTVPDVPAPGDIHVRTDISVQVGKAM